MAIVAMVASNGYEVQVCIGGAAVTEYTREGQLDGDGDIACAADGQAETYVECNLHTPVSYKVECTEKYSGGDEVSMWPVTPYTVRVCMYVCVYVCGVCVMCVYVCAQPTGHDSPVAPVTNSVASLGPPPPFCPFLVPL